MNELIDAADDKQLSKTIARCGRVDLLCLDELGYMERDRRGAEPLFRVLTEREERSAVAIASTSRSRAGSTPSPAHAYAPRIVDRLTFAGHVIEIGTNSQPLAHARNSRPHPRRRRRGSRAGRSAADLVIGMEQRLGQQRAPVPAPESIHHRLAMPGLPPGQRSAASTDADRLATVGRHPASPATLATSSSASCNARNIRTRARLLRP